jgi:hypothetical protein
MDDLPDFLRDRRGFRIALIAESFERLTGKPLIVGTPDIIRGLWLSPSVIVAHGTEPDPIFFFGNKAALVLFEMPASAFLSLPSRLSAEAAEREERARFMDRVARNGFVDDYSGIRISAKGRRFRIQDATVWNLVDAAGDIHGQAATFDHWTFLDP